MRRVVAFGGSMICAILAAGALLVWSGSGASSAPKESEGIQVEKVADKVGWTADLSDFPVVKAGREVKGEKKLLLLGKAVFLNEEPVFWAGERNEDMDKSGMHAVATIDELRLMYADLILNGAMSDQAVFKEMEDFAAGLPGLKRASAVSTNSFAVHVTLIYPEEQCGITGASFSKQFVDRYDRWVPEVKRKKARRQFANIVEAVNEGKVLVLKTDTGYDLREK